MTAAVPPSAVLPVVRLAAGEAVHLDVEFCDLVPPNRGETDEAIRFKGRRLDAHGKPGELVRVFVDAAAAAVAMQKSGVLRGELPPLPIGEAVQPVPLAQKRLTIRRVQGRNQITWLDIRPREGTVAAEDELLLADYHWAYGQARNTVAPLLEVDGYPLGAAELLTITTTLFHERRRGRHNRG